MKTKRNGPARRRPSRRLCMEDLGRIYVERAFCGVCGETFWHVEVSEDGSRDWYIPPCPSCGGPCMALHPGLEG